jgi:hypothetical protein
MSPPFGLRHDDGAELPMVETLRRPGPAQQPQEPVARGSETILLVEDDASAREVTCDFLRRLP